MIRKIIIVGLFFFPSISFAFIASGPVLDTNTPIVYTFDTNDAAYCASTIPGYDSWRAYTYDTSFSSFDIAVIPNNIGDSIIFVPDGTSTAIAFSCYNSGSHADQQLMLVYMYYSSNVTGLSYPIGTTAVSSATTSTTTSTSETSAYNAFKFLTLVAVVFIGVVILTVWTLRFFF